MKRPLVDEPSQTEFNNNNHCNTKRPNNFIGNFNEFSSSSSGIHQLQQVIINERMSTENNEEMLQQVKTEQEHQENNNENAKKVKLGTSDVVVISNNGITTEENNKPSRVVHIRNIPSDVSETEIVHLGIPFGRVSNVLVLKGKNQAFLELAEECAAVAMVSYFTNCVAQLRGRSVYVQYSTHKELKTDQSHSNANSAAQAALQAAQALVVNGTTSSAQASSTPSVTVDTQGGPNTVLRVIIEQMLYPVTLDVLYQIFSRVGKVLRIVTFTKNGFFQALIQYPDVVMAQAAKLTLDSQNIYNGCCTLRIEYSKLSSLNVRYNNDKSRDYTNPNLPTGEPSIMNGSNTTAAEVAALLGFGQTNGAFPQQQAASNGSVLGQFTSQQQQLLQLQQQQNGPSGNTNGGGGGGSPGGFLAAMQLAAAQQQHQQQHHHQHAAAVAAAAAAAAASVMGPHHPHHPMNNPHHPMHHLNPHHPHHHRGSAAGILAAVHQAANNSLPGCVLLVSNLNEESITPDGLFTLFGVYGDVQRVKILFNKKDSALVQMREPAQAQLALTYLDRLKLSGKIIRVTLSKHGLVQMPKEGQPDAGLTKDYTNSPLHRFKKPDSKNYQNIYPPSATLHLSNIPASVSEDEISQAFANKMFQVKGFKFFPKDRKMALLQLPSIEDAAEALIKMHNFQLRENSHLRVSFSKSTI